MRTIFKDISNKMFVLISRIPIENFTEPFCAQILDIIGTRNSLERMQLNCKIKCLGIRMRWEDSYYRLLIVGQELILQTMGSYLITLIRTAEKREKERGWGASKKQRWERKKESENNREK